MGFKKKHLLLPFGAAVLTMALVLAGVYWLEKSEREKRREKSHTDALTHLSVIRARIEDVLNAKLYVTSGLAAYVSTHPEISQKEFEALARPLFAQLTGVQSIRLARNAVISHVYPMLPGAEGGIGVKLLEQPKFRGPVQRAIDSRQTVMAGPLQATPAAPVFFVSRTPIFLVKADGSAGSHLWGLTCIFMYRDAMLREVGLGQEPALFRYALRGKDGQGRNGEVFWGDASLFHEPDAVIMDISLPGGSWQIASTMKEDADSSRLFERELLWFRMGGAALALVSAYLVWFLMRNPARLREMVQQATAAQRASEAEYKELMELAPAGIFILDQEDNCLFVNSQGCKMLGYDREQILRLNIKDFAPEDDLMEQRNRFRKILDGTLVTTECRMKRKDGSVFAVEIGGRRLPGGRVQVVVRDVSERKQIEFLREKHQLEMERVSRLNLLGEMASGLAHELGQPLAAAQNYVSGCIRRMQAGNLDLPSFLDTLGLAKSQLERAGGIVRHIKGYGHKREPRYASLEINQLIHEAVRFLDHEIAECQANIRLSLDHELPAARADKIEIEQVMINLMKNGLESMHDAEPAKRELVVRSYRDMDGFVSVSFEDRGRGILPENMDKLFAPFFTTKPDGTGLGLSISRTIIDAHGGSMGVRSLPEHGSLFYFRLPVEGAK